MLVTLKLNDGVIASATLPNLFGSVGESHSAFESRTSITKTAFRPMESYFGCPQIARWSQANSILTRTYRDAPRPGCGGGLRELFYEGHGRPPDPLDP